MDSLEPGAQSFIVKIWVEEHPEEGGRGTWRGHVTHVPSGKRRYLKNLGEIEDFIAPYLEEMGVKLDKRWRVRSWLTRLMGRSRA
jgi:hypothetical protein